MLMVNQLVGFGVGGAAFPPYQGVDILPVMTSATVSGVTVSASSTLSASYQPWFAANNLYAAEAGQTWIASVSTGLWQAQFPSVRHIYRYSIRWWNNASVTTRAPRDWTLQGSNDGSSWMTVDTQTSQTGWAPNERREYTLAAPAAFSYWRLNVSANNGNAALQIAEIELLE